MTLCDDCGEGDQPELGEVCEGCGAVFVAIGGEGLGNLDPEDRQLMRELVGFLNKGTSVTVNNRAGIFLGYERSSGGMCRVQHDDDGSIVLYRTWEVSIDN